jgi:hypothetical protein
MLFGNREPDFAECLTDQPIRVKIHLPVMIRVTVRPYGKDRTGKVEI